MPYYRIVSIDSRVQRDGGYLELLGTYDPLKKKVTLRPELVKKWLERGAQPSETVKSLLKKEKIWSEFTAKKVKKSAPSAND